MFVCHIIQTDMTGHIKYMQCPKNCKLLL